ncbi:S-layer homology domain-containing protein [Paenibacillus filicis]|uniref:S-layer homology domain-containing protein n=1 Tax=Paenibacillus gyeongsangnamensis TaxID=3388067 RepID=A0ABT4QEY9_9BACL|nr:S-layer homology domain-containing protein [Paenibacillus filicis]MCZ8515383.1 S-layer homology domain-containing protein [Paenibacillus filicis]
MKKSLTLITAAAMAFSMLASSAMAGTTKTTSDYKDLTNLDPGLKSKLDVLLSNGIFEGITDDSFGISQPMTRAQFAKVACLVFGLPVNQTVRTSSFSDVRTDDPVSGWAVSYIEAAKKAGLIDGKTDSTFAPGENVTIGQLDKVFINGLGRKVNVDSNPWYADAVKQATDLNIHPANKNGAASATRADLVTGAYGSWMANRNSKEQDQVSVISAQASGDQAVQVTLDKSVDISKASLTLKQGDAVIPTVITWSSDTKSAALTLIGDAKLSGGDYNVTLSGLDSIKTASTAFTVPSSAPAGGLNYSVTNAYDLSSVIDNGLTAMATGADGYATKSEVEDPTVSKFAKEIILTAATTSGNEVALPGMIQSIASTNPAVVKAVVSFDHRGYILGKKPGKATVSIIFTTLNGGSKQLSIPINVKDDAVTGQLVEARETSIEQNLTVTGGVYTAQFNAYSEMDLKVTDNYGITYEPGEVQKYNFALGTIFIPEYIVGDSKGPIGSVSIDKDGTVHVTGNVTQFNLTAILPTGKRATSEVKIRKP